MIFDDAASMRHGNYSTTRYVQESGIRSTGSWIGDALCVLLENRKVSNGFLTSIKTIVVLPQLMKFRILL
jgi:hypothetical protein